MAYLPGLGLYYITKYRHFKNAVARMVNVWKCGRDIASTSQEMVMKTVSQIPSGTFQKAVNTFG
jgi:hypothetical protein